MLARYRLPQISLLSILGSFWYIFPSLLHCGHLNLPRGSGWSRAYWGLHYRLCTKPRSPAAISKSLADTFSLCPFYIVGCFFFPADNFKNIHFCSEPVESYNMIWTMTAFSGTALQVLKSTAVLHVLGKIACLEMNWHRV